MKTVTTFTAPASRLTNMRRTATVTYMMNETCSRCEAETLPTNMASTDGEIPFCKDCIGVCRLCSRDGFNEELLEHGVCESCCLDLDEIAEEENFYGTA